MDSSKRPEFTSPILSTSSRWPGTRPESEGSTSDVDLPNDVPSTKALVAVACASPSRIDVSSATYDVDAWGALEETYLDLSNALTALGILLESLRDGITNPEHASAKQSPES